MPAPVRRILLAAAAALCIGLTLVVVFAGWSPDPTVKAFETLAVVGAVAAVLFGLFGLIGMRLADYREPESDEDFEALVADALDELPDLLRALVENHNVAVVISDGGRRRRAYGLYHGDGAARDDVPDRIVIYRDTLRREFGHDPELLRDQVTR